MQKHHWKSSLPAGQIQGGAQPCPLFPGCARETLPGGMLGQSLGLTVERYFPPVEQFAELTLTSGSVKGVLKHLQQAWAQRHVPHRHTDSPPVSHHSYLPPLFSRSLCYKAGFCLCDKSLSSWRRFARRVEQWLRELHRKGHRAREVIRSRGAVIQISTSHSAVERFFHMSYSNLKHLEFVFVELSPCDADTLQPPLPDTRMLQRTAPSLV